MIEIVEFDHISMSVPKIEPQIDFLERVLGFRLNDRGESPDGYFSASLDVPGRSCMGWEILVPNNPNSYLHRFLDGPNGPGLHHTAIRVRSAAATEQAIRDAGFETWGYHANEEGNGITYLHPKGGGRGFLFQFYSGDPWHDSEPFEDTRDHTLGIIAIDHLSHAHPDMEEMGDWYERLFGFRTVSRSEGDGADRGFRTRVLEVPTGQLRFEVLQPAGARSFVQTFLDRRGPSMHHVTFEVGDWQRAVDACAHHRIPIFGERSGARDGVPWREAFIHPRHTGGMLIQFFWQAAPGAWE